MLFAIDITVEAEKDLDQIRRFYRNSKKQLGK